MSDLHFITGESRRFASAVYDVMDAVRQARPDGGVNASAPAVPGVELTSLMQSVEEKCMGTCTVLGRNLDNCIDSLDAADGDFTATEEDNGQPMSSIVRGLGFGGVNER